MAAHRPDLDEVKPRRIPAKIRYAVAAAVTLAVAVVLFVLLKSGSHLTTVALVVTSLGLVAMTLLVANFGIRPRVRGQYLEVTTLLGRQSLDLTTIAGGRWERSRSGTVSLRLRDDVTDVLITMPLPRQAFPVVKEALRAAGERGVLMPQRVTRVFNLPDIPGAPRNEGNRALVMVGVLVGAMVLGAVIGLVASV